jgi:hypothetical protein
MIGTTAAAHASVSSEAHRRYASSTRAEAPQSLDRLPSPDELVLRALFSGEELHVVDPPYVDSLGGGRAQDRPRSEASPCLRTARSRSAFIHVVVVAINDGQAAWDDGARYGDRLVVVGRPLELRDEAAPRAAVASGALSNMQPLAGGRAQDRPRSEASPCLRTARSRSAFIPVGRPLELRDEAAPRAAVASGALSNVQPLRGGS